MSTVAVAVPVALTIRWKPGPRWSYWTPAGIKSLLPASMAGLPGSRAMVMVGPPLSCSGPSFGSTLSRSVPTQPELPSVLPIRLWPSELNPPSHPDPAAERNSRPQYSSSRVAVPLQLKMPPPSPAELPLMVEAVIVSVPPVVDAAAVVSRPSCR